MRSTRGLLAAILLALVACTSGPPTGPVERPQSYPDRSSAEAVWRSFVWAWREGDVDVLLKVTGWSFRSELRRQIEVNGAEGVSAYYRENAQDLRVLEAEWTSEGESVSYLRVLLASSSVPRASVRFSFVQRPDGWVLTERLAQR